MTDDRTTSNFNSFFSILTQFFQTNLGIANLFWPPALALVLVLIADMLIQQIFIPNLLKLKSQKKWL